MASPPRSCLAYVGCRTTRERNARGEGINVFRVDSSSGHWQHVQLVPGLVNPSYLALDRTGEFLYSVHGDSSEVTSFRRDPDTGRLAAINSGSTEGKNPVHLSIDPANRWIVVANHVTSTVAVLPRHEDGSVGKVTDLVRLAGQVGPHRVEQPFAKPHQVEFDRTGRFIVVPDKGLDQVFTFRLDAERGKLAGVAAPAALTREGAGPRHIAFHPANAFAYVINELDSTVMACRFDAATGAVSPFQVSSALPDTYVGNSRGSEIAVSRDGRFVYASNRGHDSITVFAVDPATGRLAPSSSAPGGGKTPRFFCADSSGDFLHVANEDSDTIIAFRIDKATGALSPTGGEVRTGSPVCIVFAPAS